MNTFLSVTFELLVILALVLANGFFVAAEFALVKVRSTQLRPMAKTGGWRVKFALKATTHLDAALSATQLGITLASLGLGWLGEPFLAHRLAPVLRYLGITDATAISSISFAMAFAVITTFHIVLGELAPKSLAIQRSKSVSLWTAAPLMFFYYMLYPFIWVLNGFANRLLHWFGLQAASEGEHAFSPEELEYVFSRASHLSPSDALISRLMVQSLRVRKTTARQIMLPREKMVVLRLDHPMQENLRTMQISGHSRYPVCDGSDDNVRGLLLAREWLWQIQGLGAMVSFEPLIRPVLKFHPDTPVPVILEQFRSARSHLAVVIDKQDKVVGIVAFEDVIEEIVGDIQDEMDIGKGNVFRRDQHVIVVSGDMLIRELQAETGWDTGASPDETVAEWLSRSIGHAPRRGDTHDLGELRVTADEVSSERVRRVRVEQIVTNGKGPDI